MPSRYDVCLDGFDNWQMFLFSFRRSDGAATAAAKTAPTGREKLTNLADFRNMQSGMCPDGSHEVLFFY